ncbi:hypothetical protein QVD17_35390 [Tagetes erecta]|uniref:Uncharacterized protein n=1 Tax=Tagetes erecta TaxID=13708 RepID=A0AAD8NL64_TARER|nr:hypothetical protein QVD17_35390 [Tagetes erecta]
MITVIETGAGLVFAFNLRTQPNHCRCMYRSPLVNERTINNLGANHLHAFKAPSATTSHHNLIQPCSNARKYPQPARKDDSTAAGMLF